MSDLGFDILIWYVTSDSFPTISNGPDQLVKNFLETPTGLVKLKYRILSPTWYSRSDAFLS